MARKKFEDLNLTDAFLFAAAMEDEETCQLVLELILGRSIGPVKVQVERSMLFSSDFRYVRFDVFASQSTDISFDVEMQNGHKKELPKRARYHQSEMDAVCLEPGCNFNDLPDSLVVFICTFDPFSSNLYRYVFEETCKETGQPLGDGTCKIFLSTKGKNTSEVPKELVDFLRYVEDSSEQCAENTNNEQIRHLNQKLMSLKKSRRLEEKYMTMQELMKDQREEGREEGIIEGTQLGVQLMLKLINRMVQDGLSAEIPKLETDSAFCREMLEKYHIM